MKKTLIALTVSAGAIMSVSGIANAYTNAFSGGDISLGGSITTPSQAGVYEGKVGSLNGLDATINIGDTQASITAPANAGLIALRTGAQGVESTTENRIANITFNGETLLNAASGTSFNAGKIDMTLPVRDGSGSEIGNVVFPVQVVGVTAQFNKNDPSVVTGSSMYADNDSRVFYGGLPEEHSQAIANYDPAITAMEALFSDITEYLPAATSKFTSAVPKDFTATNVVFHAAYAAGIAAGDNITVNLNAPATAGDVTWNASLPVVVSYK